MGGQLPPRVDTSHRHYADQLVDRESRSLLDTKSEIELAKTLPAANGEQRIRLLGPFRVNFDDEGLATPDGVRVLDVSAGQIVMSLRCEVVTAWDADADLARLSAYVGTALGASGDGVVAKKWIVGNNYVTPIGTVGNEAEALLGGHPGAPFQDVEVLAEGGSHRLISDGAVFVTAALVAGATQGEADIYALIAEPVE